MSQTSTQSYGYRSRSRSIGKKGRRSRTPSLSPGRGMAIVPRTLLRRSRNVVTSNTVHQFVRMTSTSSKNSLEAITSNFWGLDNTALTGFSYGGTTPLVYGNQISIYFDLLSAHIDLYSNAGALIYQAEYGLPSVAEFVALYQEYRIDWVQIDVMYQNENAYKAGTGSIDSSSKTPVIYIVKDYNDGGFTSMTTMQQEQDVQQWTPGMAGYGGGYTKTIKVKPRPQFIVANAAGTVGGTAGVPGLQWFDLDDSQTVPHYGVKMAANQFFPDTGVTFAGNIGFQFTYHLSFRNTR